MTLTNMEFVNTALSVIIYIPLTILGLYAGAQLYDFVWPHPSGETTIGSQSKEALHLWDELKSTVRPILGKAYGVLADTAGFVNNHLFRIAAVFILGAYLIGSYHFTHSHKSNATFKKYSTLINTLMTLLGGFLVIGVSSLFIKENKEKATGGHPYPTGTEKRLKWMWHASLPVYKSLIGLAITLGLVILCILLVNRFSFLSVSVTVIIQIAAILALLFGVFMHIRGKASWMKKIEGMPLFNFLYHFIFVIPCTVLYLTNFTYLQIKDTPWVVYIVLLIEIITVAMYFLIPILIRYLYVSGRKKNELLIQQAAGGNDTGVIGIENTMIAIMGHLDVDWERIIQKHLYKKKNEELLQEYLSEQGYKSANAPYKKEGLLTRLFKKSLSREAAVSYVQTNTPILIESTHRAKLLKAQSEELREKEAKAGTLFDSKILLDGPIYTDTKKDIGSYENLGSGSDMYNYNYGISGWFFIFERPPSARVANNKFTSIFSYGNRPNILFNVKKNKLQVKMNSGIDSEKVVFEMDDLPLQTWNNIVINYNGGTLDIFINNKLVSSTDGIVPYMKYDQVTVGENEGVSGGCCNVVYFSSPLTLRKIDLYYNVFKNKNPPII